jgi:hypothetical protein
MFLVLLMLAFSRSVHSVQGSEEKSITERPKKRSQSDKKGWFKHKDEQFVRILRDLNDLKRDMRGVQAQLEASGFFHYPKPLIQKTACRDEVDLEILELLYQSVPAGLYPKDIAFILSREPYKFKLDRFQVLRRLKAMNRRFEKELRKHVAEKRGHRWALRSFAVDAWGETEKGFRDEGGEHLQE